jgi:hypothetical protein
MKQLRYILEAIVLYVFVGICFLLTAVPASNLGGFIGRTVGPRLAASRKARRNLDLALPGLPDAEKSRIITDTRISKKLPGRASLLLMKASSQRQSMPVRVPFSSLRTRQTGK